MWSDCLLPRIYNLERVRDFILMIYKKYENIIENQNSIVIESKIYRNDEISVYFKTNYKVDINSLNKHYFHSLIFLNIATRIKQNNSKSNNSGLIEINLSKIKFLLKNFNIGKQLDNSERKFFKELLLSANKVETTANQDRNIKQITKRSNYFVEILKSINKCLSTIRLTELATEIEVIYEDKLNSIIKSFYNKKPKEITLISEKRTFLKWGMDLGILTFIEESIVKKYLNLNTGLITITSRYHNYNEIKKSFIDFYRRIRRNTSIVEIPKLKILTIINLKLSFFNFNSFFEEFIRLNRHYIKLNPIILSILDIEVQHYLEKWIYKDNRGYYHSIQIIGENKNG